MQRLGKVLFKSAIFNRDGEGEGGRGEGVSLKGYVYMPFSNIWPLECYTTL